MTDTPSTDATRSQDAAFAVLMNSADDAEFRREYKTIAETFTEHDYRQIIALAWRYQFNDDRYAFKRDIRELQQYVCAKVQIAEPEA